jgi:hypothetical protein
VFLADAPEARARASRSDSGVEQSAPRPTESVSRWGCRGTAMTDDPIDLDGRRSAAEQREIEMRRRPANSQPPITLPPQPHLESLEDQMLAEPARTWVEVMEKWRFLLHRYAATPEAGDERIQTLIKRALGDMERLRKREELE